MNAADLPAEAEPDRVIVDRGDGATELSLDEFFGLPLPERIRMVLERKVTFFSKGISIDPRQALNRLRRTRALR